MRIDFKWVDRGLFNKLRVLPLLFSGSLDQFMQEWATRFTEYAQTNAPWEDRTGDAREGLNTDVEGGGFGTRSLVLYHTVDYGIWLEVRWSGQYAIIVPTLEAMGPEMMRDLNGFLGRLP